MAKINFGSSFFNRFSRRETPPPISPEDNLLARFDFVVTFGSDFQREFQQSYDDRLEDIINSLNKELITRFDPFVHDMMGDEVAMRIDRLTKGSIVGTITLILVSGFSVYTYISQYKDFTESLGLIRDQLQSTILRALGRRNNIWDANVNVVLTRTPHVMRVQQLNYQIEQPVPIYSKAFFWYLFISNILLIIILGILLYKAVVSVYFVP